VRDAFSVVVRETGDPTPQQGKAAGLAFVTALKQQLKAEADA